MHKYWPTLKSWINFTFSTIYAGGALANRSVQVSERASRMNKAALTNWSGENLPVCYRWCKKKKKWQVNVYFGHAPASIGSENQPLSVMGLAEHQISPTSCMLWAFNELLLFQWIKRREFYIVRRWRRSEFSGPKDTLKKKIHQRHLIAI